MKEIEMTLPRFGYTVIWQEKEIDRDRAAEYLTPKRQRKITKAAMGEQTVTVERTVIRCPRCGKDTPAYTDLSDRPEMDEPFRSIPAWRIAEWADRQTRLFRRQSPELRFREPMLPQKWFICPLCRMASKESVGDVRVRITETQKRIRVSVALGIEDLFAIPWVSSLQIGNEELYETVAFHFQKHRIYLTVEDENGVRYATRDISNVTMKEIADEPVIKAIRLYKPVSRALKRCFTEKYGGKLPFFTGKWNINCCFFLTKLFGRGPVSYEITIFYRGVKFEWLILADKTALVRASFINEKNRRIDK